MWSSTPSPMYLLQERPSSGRKIQNSTSKFIRQMVKPSILNIAQYSTRYFQANNRHTDSGLCFDDFAPELQKCNHLDLDNKSEAMLGHRFGQRIPFQVPNLVSELIKPPIIGGNIDTVSPVSMEESNFDLLGKIYQAGSILFEMLMPQNNKNNCSKSTGEAAESVLKQSVATENSTIFSINKNLNNPSSFLKENCDLNTMLQISEFQTVAEDFDVKKEKLKMCSTGHETGENGSASSALNAKNVSGSTSSTRKKKKTKRKINNKKSETKSLKSESQQMSQPVKEKTCCVMEFFETLRVGGARRVTKKRKNKRPQLAEYSTNLPRPTNGGCQKVYQCDSDEIESNNETIIFHAAVWENLTETPREEFEIVFDMPEFCSSSYNTNSLNPAIPIVEECANAVAFIINGNDDIYASSESGDDSCDGEDEWQMFQEDFEHFQDCLLMEDGFEFTLAKPATDKALNEDLDDWDEGFRIVIGENEQNDVIFEQPIEVLASVNRKWNEDMKDCNDVNEFKVTKVRFAPDDSLTDIRWFEKSNEEELIDSDWFLYKVMRCRFKKRIGEMEKILSPCFNKIHRDKIYHNLFSNC